MKEATDDTVTLSGRKVTTFWVGKSRDGVRPRGSQGDSEVEGRNTQV